MTLENSKTLSFGIKFGRIFPQNQIQNQILINQISLYFDYNSQIYDAFNKKICFQKMCLDFGSSKEIPLNIKSHHMESWIKIYMKLKNWGHTTQ